MDSRDREAIEKTLIEECRTIDQLVPDRYCVILSVSRDRGDPDTIVTTMLPPRITEQVLEAATAKMKDFNADRRRGSR